MIFIYDFLYQEIPDHLTFPGIGFAFGFAIFYDKHWPLVVLAAAVGAGVFLIQYLVSRGEWIGAGDIRLGAFMGLVVGWPGIVAGLLGGYVLGAIVGILLLAGGKANMKSVLPFGTFLTVATFVVMLWGEQIINWYVKIVLGF